MRKNFKLLGAVAVAGLVATTGSAFTAGNTLPSSNTAGFGSVTATGATVTSIDYTLNADGTQITNAAIVFAGDQRGKTAKAGFGTTASGTCTEGTYTAAATNVTESTAFSCGTYTQSVASAGQFNVSIVQ